MQNKYRYVSQAIQLKINHLFTMINWFVFVWFYGISTIVGYLMPSSFYTYIKYMNSNAICIKHFKTSIISFFAYWQLFFIYTELNINISIWNNLT